MRELGFDEKDVEKLRNFIIQTVASSIYNNGEIRWALNKVTRAAREDVRRDLIALLRDSLESPLPRG